MDCTEHGGVIDIMWNENITFYGQKHFTSSPDCELQDNGCTASVVGTGMGERLLVLCDGEVRCVVEMEQTWIIEDCGANTLNYMEVTYNCAISGTGITFPADNYALTLVQRRRRWSDVKPTMIQRFVSIGLFFYYIISKLA